MIKRRDSDPCVSDCSRLLDLYGGYNEFWKRNKLFARKRVIPFFFFFLVEIDNIFLKRISLSNHLNEIKDVREKGMFGRIVVI